MQSEAWTHGCRWMEKWGQIWRHLILKRQILHALTWQCWAAIQGEADLPEMSNIGPSACLPLGRWLPLPHHVFPGSLHFQISASWGHIQHLSVLDTSVCAGPSHSPSTNTQTIFSHSHSQLSPPQKESAALPGSLDYASPSALPRRLTLLCNHHYRHNCFSSRVTKKSALKYHTINAM